MTHWEPQSMSPSTELPEDAREEEAPCSRWRYYVDWIPRGSTSTNRASTGDRGSFVLPGLLLATAAAAETNTNTTTDTTYFYHDTNHDTTWYVLRQERPLPLPLPGASAKVCVCMCVCFCATRASKRDACTLQRYYHSSHDPPYPNIF